MQDNHIYLSNLIEDENNWKSELELQKDQITIFEGRLGEVLKSNTNSEVRASGEQFQNKLIRQREVIDILLHDIQVERDNLNQFAKDHPIALDHMYFQDHKGLRERIFTNTDIFRGMRNDFYSFVEKWI